MLRLVILLASLALCVTAALGAPNANNPTAEKATEEINQKAINKKTINGSVLDGKALQEQFGGVVTDQTITVAGQDFYQYFVALWRDKPMSERFVIAIRERPSARWGNEIWVEYAQRRVFQAVLPANRSNIKAISTEAVEITYQNVVDTEVQRLFFRDKDIGPDEF